ncbi:helix-turn-helix domain-containing protein [Rhizobium sp. TRM95796]|uniref:helix-turn-helix domain-containing protein n=1 Tax=Rhizobium sp. TRM95796 TaxID=2979862 RepID=UPI0021E6EBCC|nr:AraC family transcriptional regulator [Rhizobium sp. TRM95796]MCV3767918.1 AraC family transcriptional regulator [Rhizobium sp. TRM95796]
MQVISVVEQNAHGNRCANDGGEVLRPLTARERDAVRRAGLLIEQNLSNPLSLGQLSDMVGLSQRRLSQGFREQFGSTIFGYLRESRLRTARRLLGETEMPLKQIAFLIGYGHANNLIAAYRERFGVSPRRHARISALASMESVRLSA